MTSEEKPIEEQFRKILALFDLDVRPADARRQRSLEMLNQLSDSELVCLLSTVRAGGDQFIEAARHTIQATLDLRIAAAAREQSQALVGATDSFRKAVTELGIANRLLTEQLAADEKHERWWDRWINVACVLLC